MDYGNSLLIGLSNYLIKQLLSDQNDVTKLDGNVQKKILYTVLLVTYKAVIIIVVIVVVVIVVVIIITKIKIKMWKLKINYDNNDDKNNNNN